MQAQCKFPLQDLSALPQTLLGICNNIAYNGIVCQGFTFDSTTNLAVFKGEAALQAVNISTASQPSDSVSLWWLDAGESKTRN